MDFRGKNYKFKIKARTSSDPLTYADLDTDVTAIYCRLRKSTSYDIIQKYSRDAKTGYIQLTRIDEFTYQGVVDSSLTNNLEAGDYYIGIMFHFEDTDFDDNAFKGCNEAAMFTIEKSLTDIGRE